MVEFACKKFDFSEIIKCVLSIKKTSFLILNELFKNEESSVKQLAKALDLDRTSIQKAVKELLDQDLVDKRQINSHKGYFYVYFVKNKEDIKKTVSESLKHWFDSAMSEVNSW